MVRRAARLPCQYASGGNGLAMGCLPDGCYRGSSLAQNMPDTTFDTTGPKWLLAG